MTGIFAGSQKGFGFVTVEGLKRDLFIPPDKTGTAFHGDEVEVRLIPTFNGNIIPDGSGNQRQEAEVARIIRRAETEIVGTYVKDNHHSVVVPDNTKIPCTFRVQQGPGTLRLRPVNGHKVVLKITDYGSKFSRPEGEIIEILGHMDDPGVDVDCIVRSYKLPGAFPDDVRRQVSGIPQDVNFENASESVRSSRLDLRNLPTVTIDGPATKDIDDAISVTRDGNSYVLGVHIADVANYVRENTPLDREALNRGTSYYLADRVIPMLPHELSNGICSLNQGEDRFALSCIMTIDKSGEITDSRICETVIRSDAKLSYPGVMKLFDENDETEIHNALVMQNITRGLKTKQTELVRMLKRARRLARILNKKRCERGAIDFETTESDIILDKNGRPVDIQSHERNEATELIENFMLLANATVAETYYWFDVPFVYRTHGQPERERIDQLKLFIRNYGYKIPEKSDNLHSKTLRDLMEKLKGTPEEAVINRMALRSMQRAVYSTDCGGHFGLALKYYTHFTSPIRRYPDLQIHRIIKDYLHGKMTEDRMQYYNEILTGVCAQSSTRERLADEAERETDKLKKAEYMREHLGEEYEGVISGLISKGFFVELPNTVEGMVNVAGLRDDYYNYDEASYRLIGERTGRTFEIGQRVKVRCDSVDVISRSIDFSLLNEAHQDKNGHASKSGINRKTKRVYKGKKNGRRTHSTRRK